MNLTKEHYEKLEVELNDLVDTLLDNRRAIDAEYFESFESIFESGDEFWFRLTFKPMPTSSYRAVVSKACYTYPNGDMHIFKVSDNEDFSKLIRDIDPWEIKR